MFQRRRGFAVATGVAVSASLMFGGIATAQSESAAPATTAPITCEKGPGSDDGQLKIGVVTDVGRLDDKSFNQFSNQGAVDAAEALGGTHQVIVTQEVADYGNNIQTLIDDGYDVIVTIGFLIGSNTLACAKANPDLFFLGVDQFASEALPNYQGVLFNEAQPGYLVGIIAASLSESGVIGAVGGTNVPAVVAYRDGYINGAKSVNPDIEVLYVESDPNPVIGFDNPARGQEIATQMIGAGADVIFQIAGNTGRGALEVACAEGIHGIGVDVDQAESIPELAPCIVTSAEKKLQATVKSVIESAVGGTFQGGNVVYDAKSTPPAIGISPYHDNADLITPEIQALVDAAFQGFVDGTVDPNPPAASPAP